MTIHKFRRPSKPPRAIFDLTIVIGRRRSVRVVAHNDLHPPLVELWIDGECTNLTSEQASDIAAALVSAAVETWRK